MPARRILVTADTVGGVWTYALDLARAFGRTGVETLLVVLGPGPQDKQRENAAAVPGLTLMETGLPLDWTASCEAEVRQAIRALVGIARDHAVDSVHLHAPALADGRFGVPVVAVNHSCLATWWRAVRGQAPMPAEFLWRAVMTARGLDRADAVLAPSRAFAEATAEAYGLSRRPAPIHNGRHRDAIRVEDALEDSIFAAGRLWDDGKGISVLDDAAVHVAFAVRAAGPLVAPHGAVVGLSNILALGSLSDTEMADRLARRPVFCSTALYEPFGLAVLEAAQSGCALVLTDIPTFRELWNGVAVFVPPGDAGAVAAALGSLVPDRDRRLVLGEAARERAACYTVDRMASATLRVHERLWARSGRERAA